MPLTKKGEKIMAQMVKEYGPEKAKEVFYASVNKGTLQGVHAKPRKRVRHMKRYDD